MTITTQEKRNVAKFWIDSYPRLNTYTQDKLYMILEPFIIGIEIVKLPREDMYRPHFMIYPLYGNSLGSDLKSCLKCPVLQFELRNQDGVPYDIPYKNISLTKEAIIYSENQISSVINMDVTLTSFLHFTDLQLQNRLFKAQFQQPDLFKIKLYSSLYISTDKAEIVINEILENSKFWDMEKFNRYYGDFNKWYNNLKELNREKIILTIESNKLDGKIKKLSSFEIL